MRETMFRMLFCCRFFSPPPSPFLPFSRVFLQFAFSFPPVRSNLRRTFIEIMINRAEQQRLLHLKTRYSSVAGNDRNVRAFVLISCWCWSRRALLVTLIHFSNQILSDVRWKLRRNISDTGGFHLCPTLH